ncbi:hypothetical protein RTBOTA2_004531 [Rhodotorula toruloides]|uniref:Transcription factor IIIC 90kDa subunit N-terminal domain-containing protein n=1 Tax=Rhodotorula toruloides TaxID=5286 RepID=A0A2T0AIC3_RHOTO|nr:hypothetical protein RTBOTA2_004531 [Rhodotorula toruloides]PRQ77744.1 hypothetical protein AAT19DRAFT_8812 [Rhodotorula toruloides]
MSPAPRAVLLGSSNLPYAPVSPSPSALAFSQDGQYAVVARGEIHLLTPTLGYSPALSAASTSVLASGTSATPLPTAGTKGGLEATGGKGKEREQDAEEWCWFKTGILVEKKNVVKWSEWVDEYDIDMPGMVEPFWRAAAWSPSGVSQLGGCMLATITTNGEALLFEPKKNAVSGEWREIDDLTSKLIKDTVPNQSKYPEQTAHLRRDMVAAVLRCQSSAIAWSSAVPGYAGDASILALGHRSGEVTLWKIDEERKANRIKRFRPAKEVNIVNVLAWSEWKVDGTTATSLLAIADADGRVLVSSISQSLDASEDVDHSASRTVEVSDAVMVEENVDGRGATQLFWLEEEGKPIRLVFSKLGTISIATLSSGSRKGKGRAGEAAWKVEKIEVVHLPPEGVGEEHFMGANGWAACSGIAYHAASDSLVVALSSSSIFSIALSPSPTLILDSIAPTAPTAQPDSAHLTSHARDIFEILYSRVKLRKDRWTRSELGTHAMTGKGKGKGKKVEQTPALGTEASEDEGAQQQKVDKRARRDGAKITGWVGLGTGAGGLDTAFMFESVRPDGFSYRTYASERTHLAITNFAPPATGDGASDESGEAVLAEFEKKLRSPHNSRLSSPLTVLRPLLHYLTGHSTASAKGFNPSLLARLNADGLEDRDTPVSEAGQGVAEKLEQTLWADQEVEVVRLKEAIARAVVRTRGLPADLLHEATLKQLALTRVLIKEVLSKLAATLGSEQLDESEKPLHVRLLLASSALLPPSPDAVELALLPPDALAQAYEQPDTCPACRAPVPLANTRFACCEQGHQWERCSITLALVSTVSVRTCTSCDRKALLPGAVAGVVKDGKVDELLERATCCLYCGGRWMKVR